MNRIEKDSKRYAFGRKILAISTAGLFLSAVPRWLLGISESELYEQYPWSWWVVVALGAGFMWSLFYMVKKQYDLHPNIQLRKKSDAYIHQILDDPEYELWHQEARRLLKDRENKQKRTKRH